MVIDGTVTSLVVQLEVPIHAASNLSRNQRREKITLADFATHRIIGPVSLRVVRAQLSSHRISEHFVRAIKSDLPKLIVHFSRLSSVFASALLF